MQAHNDSAHADSSETDTTSLQPMGFTDIIDGMFQLYRNHFRLLFGIAIVYLVLVLVLSILSSVPIVGIVVSIFAIVGNPLVSFFFVAALFYASARAYLGSNITVRAAFGQVWRRFWSYLGSTLLFFLVQGGALAIIGVVGLLLFASGFSLDDLGDSSLLSFALSFIMASVFILILWLPFAIYFGVRWGFYPLAVLFEEATARNALRRSAELVKGSWWRVLGIAIGIGLIAIIIPLIFHTATTFLLALAGIVDTADSRLLNEVGWFSYLIQTFVTTAITALTTPIGIIGATLLYFDLRIRKEGSDIGTQETD